MRTARKIRYFFKKYCKKFHRDLDKLEIFISDVLFDRRDTMAARVTACFLWPFSILFEQIVRCRRYLYNRRILTSNILGCPVIVVGNLTVGGTGKTPVVEKIARELKAKGRKIAILSRGYKSKGEHCWRRFARWITHGEAPLPRIVSDGKSVLLTSEKAGDEPYMLARNLPGVVVLVDKDRVKAGNYAIKKFGCDILVLDDGLQYASLLGHVNLLLIDKTNPFGNGHLLPRGILREPISQIKRASYVLLTKADGVSDDSVVDIIRKYNSTAEIIQCAHFPRNLTTLDGKEVMPINAIDSQKIIAFSGIASPDSFENFLIKNGADIVLKKRFVDHHRFSKNELENIFSIATSKGAEFAVTTEKDAVRIPKDFVCPIPTYFLKIDIEILAGQKAFDRAISKFD